jgi:hypothetical protein
MHVAELHTDNIVEEDVITESLTYLREHGYVAGAKTRYVVVSDSGNGYLVQEIETHNVPFAEADAAEDQYTLYACTCDAYRYHDGLPDLEEAPITEWQSCKHIRECVRHIKAENDERQATLTDG